MASDHAASVQGVALRVCKLGANGKPLVGTKTSFITDAFMRFGVTPEYTSGDEIEEKSANGNVCTYWQGPDVLKRVSFALAICSPSPELHEMLVGGNVLLPDTGTDPIGYAVPSAGVDAVPNGVGFELYSRAVVGGRPAPNYPYWRWLFPYAKMRLTGDRVLENGAMANEFEGWGVGNSNYGRGPTGDWMYPSDRAYQFVRSTSAPVGINDYVAVVEGSAPVNEVQTITVGTPGSGTFTLGFGAEITSAIDPVSATAAELKDALVALAAFGPDDITTSGSASGPYTVTFGGAYAGVNVPQLVPGGTNNTVTVETTTPAS